MRLKRTSQKAQASARPRAARLASFLFALLAALSVSSFGAGHAHAGTAGGTHPAIDHLAMAVGKAHQEHVHAVPCDDRGADQDGQDGCCMSMSTCSFCAPVPSAIFAIVSPGLHAGSAAGSASLPRDPPTLRRPPKLSVTA